MIKNTITKSPLTIGSDPELSLFSPLDGSFINADDTFFPEDAYSCPFGYDGNPSTLELRAEPSKSPLRHYLNIKRVLNQAKDDYPEVFSLIMKSSSIGNPTGGHVHFGHPKLRENDEYCIGLNNYLNYLLAVPVMFLQNEREALYRKISTGYGKMNDWRNQAWGIEYRVLPSFLACDTATRGILALAYTIGTAYLDEGYTTNLDEIIEKPILRDLFNSNNTKELKPILEPIYKKIMELPSYPKYKNVIDPLLKSAYNEEKLLSIEVKYGWHINFKGLEETAKQTARELSQKLTTALLIPIPKGLTFVKLQGLETNNKHFAITEISKRATHAYFRSLKEEAPIIPLKLYGIKEDRGNFIRIETTLDSKKIKLLEKTCWKLAGLLPDNGNITKIEIVRGDKNTIGLPRQLREQSILTCSAFVLAYILIQNGSLYQETKLDRKYGIVKKLRITSNTIALPFVEGLKGKRDLYKPIKTQDDILPSNFEITPEMIERLNLAPKTNGKLFIECSFSEIKTKIREYVRNSETDMTSKSLDNIREWKSYLERPELYELRRLLDENQNYFESIDTRKTMQENRHALRQLISDLVSLTSACFSNAYHNYHAILDSNPTRTATRELPSMNQLYETVMSLNGSRIIIENTEGDQE